MRVQVLRTSGRAPAVPAAGKRAGGGGKGSLIANSDGTDDEATIRRAPAEPGQVPRVCPRRRAAGRSSAGPSKGSAPWGSGGAARGPRPPTGVDQSQLSRACSRKGFLEDRPEPGSLLEPPGSQGGRAPAKAGCSHLEQTASAAPA